MLVFALRWASVRCFARQVAMISNSRSPTCPIVSTPTRKAKIAAKKRLRPRLSIMPSLQLISFGSDYFQLVYTHPSVDA